MDDDLLGNTPAANDAAGDIAGDAGLLEHIRELGGAARTVEFAPRALLRKRGALPTPENLASLYTDLATLEREGHLLTGEATESGVMTLLLTASDLPVLLTCERLVTLFGWMNEHERAMLSNWESFHLVGGGLSTAEWPGWATIYRRRAS